MVTRQAKKTIIWTAVINYRNSNNPDFHLRFSTRNNAKPTFESIKHLWDSRNDGCPLHRTAKEGEWYLIDLKQESIPNIENKVGVNHGIT